MIGAASLADESKTPLPDVASFAAAQEGYITGYIQFADAKALAVFAWASAAIAFLRPSFPANGS